MQLELREQRFGRKPDWTAWNQVLAVIWLVGGVEIIEAARKMDQVFWSSGAQIKSRQLQDEDAWALVRDQMESSRLEFIHAARSSVVRRTTGPWPTCRRTPSCLRT